MASHNNLAGTHKQTTPLNNTSSASEKRILVSTISNALFKESNIDNNNQGAQNNSVYPENNFNNIIDADDHNIGHGMCDHTRQVKEYISYSSILSVKSLCFVLP